MKIVAIDGENIAPNGYSLLCSSSGNSSVTTWGRLTSRQCFEFLLAEASTCDRIFAYGVGYDACHWIADLSDGEKERLAKTGRCYTMQGASFYRVRYIPSVLFEVSRLKGFPFSEEGAKPEETALVVDLMRWHRKPFVDVCLEWGTSQICGAMKAMKERREEFRKDYLPEIHRYCMEECASTARLAERMIGSLKGIGVPSSHPFTSGSIAGQLAAGARIHEYRNEPPPEVTEAVQMAFYGGREQVTRYGLFRDVVQWDLRSAYGWAMMQLPDLLGEWVEGRSYIERPITEWSLVKVSWDLDEHRYPVMPFPHRDANGHIHYPPRGTGWYWSPIVRAALRHYNGDIKILDAWHYIPSPLECRPFSYIGDLYDRRREFGEDPAEGLVKMLIVSTWGRMCSNGHRKGAVKGKGKIKGKTRGMLDWAGMTTALIHERMLDAINATGQEHFVSCCVDGFWTTSKVCLPWQGRGLGEWSTNFSDKLLLIRPNCYWKMIGGEWAGHTSGFKWGGNPQEILAMRHESWHKLSLAIQQRRCRGLLSSAAINDFSQMGEFYSEKLAVSLNPGFGRSGHECPTLINGDTWRRWLPYWPPHCSRDTMSFPFVSRTGHTDDRWREAAEGQAIEETME